MKGSIFGVVEEKRIASPKEWAWLVGSLLLLIIVTVFRELHEPGDIWSLLGEKLSFTHKKEMVRSITEAKQEETKKRPLARVMDVLESRAQWTG